jgi:hypothetical protein
MAKMMGKTLCERLRTLVALLGAIKPLSEEDEELDDNDENGDDDSWEEDFDEEGDE